MGNLREYIVLSRIQTAGVTALAPVLGIMSTGNWDVRICATYFLIGVLIHIYGFALNEWADYKYDVKADYLKGKPLVSGKISRNSALAFSLGAMVCAYAIALFTTKNLWSAPLLLLSIACGGFYDIKGKSVIGSDFVLGAWAFTFALSAGISVLPGASPLDIPKMLVVVGLLGGMQVLFNNSVEGGIKDLEQDRASGARTWMIFLGSKVEGGELKLSHSSVVFAYLVKALFFIVVISPMLFGLADSGEEETLAFALLAAMLASAMFFTMSRFVFARKYDRENLKKTFSVHEIVTFFLLPTAIIPVIGIFTALALMLVPLIWYVASNVVLYGKALQPQV